jgi:hypothetical protein
LTFHPRKKGAPPLIIVEKNLFKIGHTGYQEKRNFALISKMCRSLVFGKREKNCLQKNCIFKGLENFVKNRFSEKKSLGTSWRESSTHF